MNRMKGSGSTALLLSVILAVMMSIHTFAGSFEVRMYDSPMTMETGFVLADHTLWGHKRWQTSEEYRELAGHICERVVMTKLEMNAEDSGKGTVKVAIRGKLMNSPGHDKVVRLNFEIVNGDRVVGTVNADKISVEEGEEKGFKAYAELPSDAIKSDPPSRLKITMAVRNG